MTETNDLIRRWGERLLAVGSKQLAQTPLTDPAASHEARVSFVDGFKDERGHRARVATPFLSALLGITPTSARSSKLDLDDRLWWAVHDPDSRIADFGAGSDAVGQGPLDPTLGDIAIESRTETELAAMHALFRIGLDRVQPGMIQRALNAARWQIAELQPDNGTNHPWGIHVFVVLAARSPDNPESSAALMHAQTMLHNCQVGMGHPDRLSACVLWDAGQTLARLGHEPLT